MAAERQRAVAPAAGGPSTAESDEALVRGVERGWTILPIPVDRIQCDEQRMRDIVHDDSLTELSADIAAHGLLQPIGVRALDHGRFELLWGLRRLSAHRQLQRSMIVARVYESGDTPVKAVALCENLHRAAMTVSEECDAISYLHLQRNLSPEQISALVNKSRSWVLSRLALPQYPDDVRAAVLDASISLGAAEALALLADDAARALCLQHAITSRLSVRQVKDLVEACRTSPSLGEAIQAGVDAAASPVAAQPLMQPCFRCGTPRVLDALMLVRICRDECPPARAEGGNGDGD